MNTIAEMKYTGDGGNAQRIFILDAQVGWKVLVKDATQHLGGGISKYDYMEGLLNRLGGQARRLLEKYLFRWNWLQDDNPNILNAVAREADRQILRIFYQERVAYNLGRVHMVVPCPNPVKPDLMEEDPIDEPSDLEEFLDELQIAFQSPSAGFLEDLNAFRGVPRESLVK